jgi:hypothetical protein
MFFHRSPFLLAMSNTLLIKVFSVSTFLNVRCFILKSVCRSYLIFLVWLRKTGTVYALTHKVLWITYLVIIIISIQRRIIILIYFFTFLLLYFKFFFFSRWNFYFRCTWWIVKLLGFLVEVYHFRDIGSSYAFVIQLTFLWFAFKIRFSAWVVMRGLFWPSWILIQFLIFRRFLELNFFFIEFRLWKRTRFWSTILCKFWYFPS